MGTGLGLTAYPSGGSTFRISNNVPQQVGCRKEITAVAAEAPSWSLEAGASAAPRGTALLGPLT
jgi:hypothetical protein